MSRKRPQIFAFTLGAVVAAMALLLTRPMRSVDTSTPSAVSVEKPPTSPDQRMQWLADVGEAQSANDRVLAIRRLDDIPVEELPQACVESLTLLESRYGYPLNALLIRWAKVDGTAAMEWVFTNLEGGNLRNAVTDAGKAFAWHQPSKFADWLIEHPERRESYEESSSWGDHPIDWLIERDYKSALIVIEAESEWTSLSDEIATRAETSDELRDLLALFRRLMGDFAVQFSRRENRLLWGGNEATVRILSSVAKRWREIDPPGYERAVEAGEIERLQGDIAERVEPIRDSTNPEEEAELLLADALPAERQRWLQQIVRTWAETDLNAAGQWLGGLEDGQDRWAAIAVFAQQAVTIDPQAAFQWIDTVSDPTVRRNFEVKLFDHWNQTDPDGLINSLDDPSWPESTRQAIKELHLITPPVRR